MTSVEATGGAPGDGWLEEVEARLASGGDGEGSAPVKEAVDAVGRGLADPQGLGVVVLGGPGGDEVYTAIVNALGERGPGQRIVHVSGHAEMAEVPYGALLGWARGRAPQAETEVLEAVRSAWEDGGVPTVLVRGARALDSGSVRVLCHLATTGEARIVLLAELWDDVPGPVRTLCRSGWIALHRVRALSPEEAQAEVVARFGLPLTATALGMLWSVCAGSSRWLCALVAAQCRSGALRQSDGFLGLAGSTWTSSALVAEWSERRLAELGPAARAAVRAWFLDGRYETLSGLGAASRSELVAVGLLSAEGEGYGGLSGALWLGLDAARFAAHPQRDGPAVETFKLVLVQRLQGRLAEEWLRGDLAALGHLLEESSRAPVGTEAASVCRSVLLALDGRVEEAALALRPVRAQLLLLGTGAQLARLDRYERSLSGRGTPPRAVAAASGRPARATESMSFSPLLSWILAWVEQARQPDPRPSRMAALHRHAALAGRAEEGAYWLEVLRLLAGDHAAAARLRREAGSPGRSVRPEGALPDALAALAGSLLDHDEQAAFAAVLELRGLGLALAPDGLGAGLLGVLPAGTHRRLAACDRDAEAQAVVLPPFEGMQYLTPRELRVVGEVCAGRSYPQISERLGISVRTVEGHLHQVYTKLALEHRRALVDLITRALEAKHTTEPVGRSPGRSGVG